MILIHDPRQSKGRPTGYGVQGGQGVGLRGLRGSRSRPTGSQGVKGLTDKVPGGQGVGLHGLGDPMGPSGRFDESSYDS